MRLDWSVIALPLLCKKLICLQVEGQNALLQHLYKDGIKCPELVPNKLGEFWSLEFIPYQDNSEESGKGKTFQHNHSGFHCLYRTDNHFC